MPVSSGSESLGCLKGNQQNNKVHHSLVLEHRLCDYQFKRNKNLNHYNQEKNHVIDICKPHCSALLRRPALANIRIPSSLGCGVETGRIDRGRILPFFPTWDSFSGWATSFKAKPSQESFPPFCCSFPAPSEPKSVTHAQIFSQWQCDLKRFIPESLVSRSAGQGERRLWERDCTSCHPIRSVIMRVVNKSDSRCAVVRFCYHSYDYRPNWTPLSPITITNGSNFSNFISGEWIKEILDLIKPQGKTDHNLDY